MQEPFPNFTPEPVPTNFVNIRSVLNNGLRNGNNTPLYALSTFYDKTKKKKNRIWNVSVFQYIHPYIVKMARCIELCLN